MKRIVLILLLLSPTTCFAQAPTIPIIVLPAGPPAPPNPPPDPGKSTLLSSDMLYVADCTGPVVVLASPQGVVKVTSYSGPILISGKFVDGTGIRETRTFKGPNIYVVEPVTSGNCELLFIPSMVLTHLLARLQGQLTHYQLNSKQP